MKEKTWQRRPHFRGDLHYDPNLLYVRDWPEANRGFLQAFRQWLKDSSYSASAISQYSAAVRQAIGFIQKLYWQINPGADIQSAWEYLQTRPLTPATLSAYHKGLLKLAEYCAFGCTSPGRRSPFAGRITWVRSRIGWLRLCVTTWLTASGPGDPTTASTPPSAA